MKRGHLCALHPRVLDGACWVGIVGLTCVAFSLVGAHSKWVDNSAVVALVWAFWRRAMRPSMIVVECVPELETQFLKYILEDYVYMPILMGIPSKLALLRLLGRRPACHRRLQQHGDVVPQDQLHCRD